MMRHALLALCTGVAACSASGPEHDPLERTEDTGEAVQAVEPLNAPSEENAIRFLEQATFGPRLAGSAIPQPIDSVEKVKSAGITTSITSQFNAASVAFDGSATSKNLDAQFFERAITGDDQLRQRVAFALSQILVVSLSGLPSPTNASCKDADGNILEECKPKQAMAAYLDDLRANAFGNFKTLLTAITKTVAMGVYLDMVNNRAFNTAGSPIEPNENFARELLQLFTIGLHELQDDGQPKLDASGKRIPAYTEEHVKAFARALSGWTYAKRGGTGDPALDCPTVGKNNPLNYLADMLPCDVNHDRSQQTLLCVDHDKNPATAKVCQTTTQDGTATQHLSQAINNIFLHDNLPPFICKQLIQHLVTSNPSPAYVARVVAKFKDSKGDGTGSRGDMKTVIRAILEDDEARGPQPPLSQYSYFGHLRSPVLQLTNVVRWLGGTLDTSNNKNPGAKLASGAASMGQSVTKPPSVFSFYPPNATLPGDASLVAPEMAIFNASTSTTRANVMYDLLIGTTYANAGVTLSYAQMPTDPDELVLWVSRYMLHDTMSSDLQLALYEAINKPWANTVARKQKLAVMLASLSPEFAIQR